MSIFFETESANNTKGISNNMQHKKALHGAIFVTIGLSTAICLILLLFYWQDQDPTSHCSINGDFNVCGHYSGRQQEVWLMASLMADLSANSFKMWSSKIITFITRIY